MYFSLSPKQREVVDYIETGKNVFVTGPAGTGKSFLLHYLKNEYMEKGLHITASTGIAAVNIGGSTLHAWAALGIGNIPLNEMLRWAFSKSGTKLRKKIRTAKMLAIDEISMISAELFDLLNEYLKAIRDSTEPFGGLQLILFGDFLQLPPVADENELHFCFESQAWQEGRFKTIILDEIFRQDDKRFIELLNNIRFGRITRDDIEILRTRYNIRDDNSIIKATILSTHNASVLNTNNKELSLLSAREMIYKAKFVGDEKKVIFLKSACIAQELLTLKVGAQVMMLKNTYAKDGIINGSVGIVKDFSIAKNYPIVEFTNGTVITVTPEEWVLERFDYNEGKVIVDAKMTQIPLSLAWAITVHKSQGMTLDKIECDLANAFADGQIYVALSRVKSLKGLFIKSFNVNKIKANNKIISFYKDFEQ